VNDDGNFGDFIGQCRGSCGFYIDDAIHWGEGLLGIDYC
jgi:hypothetical protein